MKNTLPNQHDYVRFVDLPSMPPFLRGRYGYITSAWNEHVPPEYAVRVLGQRLSVKVIVGLDAIRVLEPDVTARLVYLLGSQARLDDLRPDQKEDDLKLSRAFVNLKHLLGTLRDVTEDVAHQFWLCDSADTMRARYGQKLKTPRDRTVADALWAEMERHLKAIAEPLKQAVE